jgi:hypothetical protein
MNNIDTIIKGGGTIRYNSSMIIASPIQHRLYRYTPSADTTCLYTFIVNDRKVKIVRTGFYGQYGQDMPTTNWAVDTYTLGKEDARNLYRQLKYEEEYNVRC